MTRTLPPDLLVRYPGAVAFQFGDTATLSAELIALVRAGRKTATCGALRDFGPDAPLPVVGRRDVAVHWDGMPALVIETLEIVRCRFDEVTEAMALAEGENEDLAGWRAGHIAYFERNGGYSPDMMLVYERFRLIEDFGSPDAGTIFT